MKKPVSFFSALLLHLCCLAQFTISGRVTDAETKEPLQGASVFAQNTTRGTTTDKDGSFRLHLDKGGYELAISFTGYEVQTILVKGVDSTLMIEMKKADNSMSEVVIKSSNEVPDGWEKYGQFFIDYFIGATPFSDSCRLENPEVLKFLYYKKSDRLKVLAAEPLVISNNALGYSIRYELDSFVYFFKTNLNSYRGRSFYTEMDDSTGKKTVWQANRRQAYYGSRLHFIRSYFDSSIKEEGFSIELLTEAKKFQRVNNPYDTAYYFFNDSTFEAELWLPATAAVSYLRRAPEKDYLKEYDLPSTTRWQVSYVTLSEPIVIKPNGYFYYQNSWINEGYWSWKNLADQLPFDYEP